MKYSISSCKLFIHNTYMLERFIIVFGFESNMHLFDKLFKAPHFIYGKALGLANF